MYLHDFQFVLREHDFALYGQVRDIWRPLEIAIRKAIPKRFHFGGVGKIVLELGPERKKRDKYRELLGVGLYHYEDFDVHKFLAAPRLAAITELIDITEKSTKDLCMRLSTDATWLFALLDAAKIEPNNLVDATARSLVVSSESTAPTNHL
jgi:hypothetical protein